MPRENSEACASRRAPQDGAKAVGCRSAAEARGGPPQARRKVIATGKQRGMREPPGTARWREGRRLSLRCGGTRWTAASPAKSDCYGKKAMHARAAGHRKMARRPAPRLRRPRQVQRPASAAGAGRRRAAHAQVLAAPGLLVQRPPCLPVREARVAVEGRRRRGAAAPRRGGGSPSPRSDSTMPSFPQTTPPSYWHSRRCSRRAAPARGAHSPAMATLPAPLPLSLSLSLSISLSLPLLLSLPLPLSPPQPTRFLPCTNPPSIKRHSSSLRSTQTSG